MNNMWFRKLIAANQEGVYKAELPNMKLPATLMRILRDFDKEGRRSLVVGGAVRDALLGLNPKDLDVEVYGIALEDLMRELEKYGETNLVGASFGVVKFTEPLNFDDPEVAATLKKALKGTPYDGLDLSNKTVQQSVSSAISTAKAINPNSKESARLLEDPVVAALYRNMKEIKKINPEYDFSVPRKDNKTGNKHTDFVTEFDPNMSPKEAASRRDLTINALGFDPIRQQVHDYYGGVEDLNNGVLRATSPAFAEDLLRVWRILQFSTRLSTPDGKPFSVDEETAKMARDMVADYVRHRDETGENLLPKERVVEEFNKAMLKGKNFNNFFQVFRDLGLGMVYPEMEALIGVEQEPKWHPEGTVEVHTQHGLAHMREIIERENAERESKGLPPFTEDEMLVRMYGILLHDIAKPTTTKKRMKDGVEKITSYGHEAAGGPVAKDILARMGVKRSVIDKVVSLIVHHMAHIPFNNTKDKMAYMRSLAAKLGAANFEELAHIMEADHSSRPPLPKKLDQIAIDMLNMAREHGWASGMPKCPIQGRHVQAFFLNHPLGTQGKHIGEWVQKATQAWLNNEFTTEAEGIEWLKRKMRPHLAVVNQKRLYPYFKGKDMGEMLNKAWEDQVKANQEGLPFDADKWVEDNTSL